MKKNGQYVGVDEKYIPKEEKYVDNSVNNEIKGLVNDGIKSAKDYISEKDNQEKIKNVAKKGLKIFKGIGIGYLAFIGFIFLMFIIIFSIVISGFFSIKKESEDMFDKNINTHYSTYDIASFNSDLEMYKGTEYGSSVSRLLDNIVTKLKKNNNHPIEVIYNNNNITNTDDMIAIKKELDSSSKYEVTFDYDSNQFINKVTITKY